MFCPKCGKENADGAGFCGSCGAPLKKEITAKSVAATAQKSHKKNGRLIGIAAAVVVVIVIIAGIATSGFGLFGPNISFDPKSSVNSYSWKELSEISNAIGAASSDEKALEIAKKYNLTNFEGKLDGTQTKSIQLTNGKLVDVQIVGFHHDDKSGGGKAGITFIFKDAIAEHQMNSTDTNAGGWEGSEMRSWLATEGMNMLPSDLSSVIVEVEKKTNNSGESQSVDSVTSTADKLWLYSVTELCGFKEQLESHPSDFEELKAANNPEMASKLEAEFQILSAEGNEYKLFKDQSVDLITGNNILQKSYNGSSCSWWERSANPVYSDSFWSVYSDGLPSFNWHALRFRAVVPGFCI